MVFETLATLFPVPTTRLLLYFAPGSVCQVWNPAFRLEYEEFELHIGCSLIRSWSYMFFELCWHILHVQTGFYMRLYVLLAAPPTPDLPQHKTFPIISRTRSTNTSPQTTAILSNQISSVQVQLGDLEFSHIQGYFL